ncbi:TonB-dependent receptor [Komagataeibacter rhaeticus]|uniref:TonB-dependent receptor n=2 Tax=Komagataeibacter rhaeticus TaxID=215221 RepID=A0A858JNT8_9PROT|nr:TonB-dependent receptor [Komagataeibacter rhaeticus]QIP36669.1 TonB-dependent receptor [Komagataeibacter rhaeticus]QOC46437.1 TonB-dependent receptor [Komagataeibacter rhaeticus]
MISWRITKILAASTALSTIGMAQSVTTRAQTAAVAPHARTHGSANHMSPPATRARPATGTAPTNGVEAKPVAETIHVTSSGVSADGVTGRAMGGGLMHRETEAKSQTTVSRDFISKLAPATSAAQMLQFAPGANIASSDPFGLSNATSINVRGMQQSEIGYLYEGAPIADVDTYTPYTTEWGDTENYQEVQLSQGQSDINAPLANATAGTMNVRTINPSHHYGGLVDYSYGSHRTNREFIRLETGDIGNTGLRGYISYSNATWDVWRGYGAGQRRHIDSKFIKEWGDGNSVSFVEAYNENNTPRYTYPSMSDWQQGGIKGLSEYTGDKSDPSTYWKSAEGGWSNLILVMPMHFKLSDRWKLHVSPYFYYGAGGGGYGSSFPATASSFYSGTETVAQAYPGQSIALPYANQVSDGYFNGQAYYTEIEFHPGINASVDFRADRHNKLTLGWWYDYNDDYESETYSQYGTDGSPNSVWGSGKLRTSGGNILYGVNYHLITQTNGIYFGDSASYLNDRLKLSAGFREVIVNRGGTNNLPGAGSSSDFPYRVGMNTAVPEPRVSASYKINPHDQIYISGTTNFKMPSASTYFRGFYNNPWDGTGYPGGYNTKNEYAITEELGFRHYGSLLNFAVSLYNINITNRNLNSVINMGSGANTVAYQTTLNGGGNTLRGADMEFSTRPWHHFSPYVSASYLHASEDNDVSVVTENGAISTIHTKGKTAVLAPEWMVNAALNYDDGHIFGSMRYHWTARQWADEMNTEALPAHGQLDLTLGYRMNNVWYLKHPQIQLNIYNLGDFHYLSGVEAITTNAYQTTAANGQTVAQNSPAYYVASTFAAMVTVSTGF